MCHYLVSRLFDLLFPPLPSSFSDWMDVVKVVGAGIAFAIGLQQYRRSVWKRLEFVSSQMKIFFDDRAVRATMQMLDWRKKSIQLFKARGEDDDEWVPVYYELVASALGTELGTHYEKEQSAIRDLVERFLEYLARFEGFLNTEVVEPQDLDPYLDYWVKLLSGHDDHSPEVTQVVLPSLWKFTNGEIGTAAFPGRIRWLGTHTDTSSRLPTASSMPATTSVRRRTPTRSALVSAYGTASRESSSGS